MFDKKRRPSRNESIFHLVAAVLLVSMTIYIWLLTGCTWTEEKFVCKGTSQSNVLVLPKNSFAVSRLDKGDFNKLINLNNFNFLMNNINICNDSDPLLIVIVFSHPNNFLKRSIVRSTWGSVISDRFKLLFLIGIPGNKRLQTSLDEENKLYGDLIQGNFIDAYRNLTYKHVMGLKWINYFCSNCKYVLKADDDVFINTPGMLEYISKNLLPYSKKNLLFCSPIFKRRVKRSLRSKWRVSFPEYSYAMYPTYCEGFAIMYSPDVAYTLYAEAQSEKYFWIDDVHITGLLAAKVNLKHSSFGSFMLMREDLDRYLKYGAGNHSYLAGPYNLKETEIQRLWERVTRS